MSKQNNINITVELDANKVPEKITWNASDIDGDKTAKAMLLSLWDSKDMNTMNIDLWTKDMSVEEMSKFFFQTYITMVETFEKATNEDQMAMAMRDFAEFFGEKMKVIQPTGKFDK
jgi:gliding motility-associated protein GldC